MLRGIDLTGKVAIVTGGYAGVGLETTRVLAEAGATVVVPARTPEKARQALAGIPRVEQGEMDLLDPASIDAFAAGFLASGRPLPILINNAGIMGPPLARRRAGRRLSSRGHQRAGVDFDHPNYEHRAYVSMEAYGQSKTANICSRWSSTGAARATESGPSRPIREPS